MTVADRIASLTPEQRALLEKLREKQRRAARTHQPPPIRRLGRPHGSGGLAPVARPGALLVHGAAQPERGGAQHHGGDPHARTARGAGGGRGARRDRAAPRRLADGVPARRRRPRAAGGRGAPAAPRPDRPLGPAGGAARAGGPAPGRRGRGRALRPRRAGRWCGRASSGWTARTTLPADGPPPGRPTGSPSRSPGPSWRRSTTPSRPAGRPRCRSRRCSTRTSPSGSASGSQGEVLEDLVSWWRERLDGRSRWRWSCPPTGRARP